jgi:peptidoglycan/LPS O-acetylase OafA/YrhL
MQASQPNPPAADGAKLGYIPALDGLRAIAVSAVIYTHYYPPEYWMGGVYWGNFGVRLFFVISGFLITDGILSQARSENFSYSSFMIKRLARLYPALLFFVLFCAAFNVDNIRSDIVCHLLYLSNVLFAVRDSWAGAASHLWSLAVEQQFYLFWPLLIVATQRHLVTALAGMIVCGPLFRFLWSAAGYGDIGAWVLPIACFDALGIGALVAVSRHGFPSARKYWALAAALGALLVIVPPPDWLRSDTLLHTGAALLFGWVVFSCVSVRSSNAFTGLLSVAWLRYLGSISYGIYLYHTIADNAAARFLAGTPSFHGTRLGGIVLTVVAACLSFHLFEEPIRKRARSFADRRRASAFS